MWREERGHDSHHAWTEPSVCSTTYRGVHKGAPLKSPCVRIKKLNTCTGPKSAETSIHHTSGFWPSCTLHVAVTSKNKRNETLHFLLRKSSTRQNCMTTRKTRDKNFLIHPCFCKQAFARFWRVSSSESQNKKLNTFLFTTTGAMQILLVFVVRF